MKRILGLFAVVLALNATSSKGVPVTVAELSPYPGEKTVTINVPGFYSGGVYAGIAKLLVNGVATDGFCIDPFHFSSPLSLPYETASLENAPKNSSIYTGPMGAVKALQIENLWAMNYSPGMDASHAAGLQIAIWMIVGQGKFILTSANDFGANDMINAIGGYQGAPANLLALTGPGQDYVIQKTPDGGSTALLLGLGTFGLAFFRRKF